MEEGVNMEVKLELIRRLIDSLNRLRFLGGGQAASFHIIPADLNNAIYRVFVSFPNIEYQSAVFLLLQDWKWCDVNALGMMLEISIK